MAYVEGDNRTAQVKADLAKGLPPHLDAKNDGVSISPDTFALANEKTRPVISAVAYLGAREIIKGLENGADIIVTGRVADASPVSDTARSWGFVTNAPSGHCSCVVVAWMEGHQL